MARCQAGRKATDVCPVRSTFFAPSSLATQYSISVPSVTSRPWRLRMKPLSSVGQGLKTSGGAKDASAQVLKNLARRSRVSRALLCRMLILYTVSKIDAERAMHKLHRYVFRPARPAPAFLRRIWAWFCGGAAALREPKFAVSVEHAASSDLAPLLPELQGA